MLRSKPPDPKGRVYRFGFGVNERRYLPIVKRTIYIHNCGILFPLDDFSEVKHKALGADCSALLGIDSASALQARLSAPRPKQPKARSFVPKAKPKRKPKKDMSFFEKFKPHRDRFFG